MINFPRDPASHVDDFDDSKKISSLKNSTSGDEIRNVDKKNARY